MACCRRVRLNIEKGTLNRAGRSQESNGKNYDQPLMSGSSECRPRLRMLKEPKPMLPRARHRRIQRRLSKKEHKSGHAEGHAALKQNYQHTIANAQTQSAS